jgi:hypothetical protein
MSEVWPTPEEVEARLAEVVALNKLCASLADAGRAFVDQAPREPSPDSRAPTPSARPPT